MEQKYLQVIGYDRMYGSEPADAITGRLYTSKRRHPHLRVSAMTALIAADSSIVHRTRGIRPALD
jgi:hypothetical protein